MSKSTHKSLKRSISDSHRPLGPLDINFVYFHSQTFWGPRLSSAGPEVGVPCVGKGTFRYFYSSERGSGSVRSLPTVGAMLGVEFLGKTLSLCVFYLS